MPRKTMGAAHRAKIAAGMRAYHAKCRKHCAPAKAKAKGRTKRAPAQKAKAPPRRRAVLIAAARPMPRKVSTRAGPTKGQKTYMSALARIQGWAPTASKKIVFTT